jgi:hypothetical protein
MFTMKDNVIPGLVKKRQRFHNYSVKVKINRGMSANGWEKPF